MDEPPPPPPPAQEDAHSVDAPPPTRSGGFVELLHEVSSGVPMEASTGQPDWLGEGMDPKSSYLLKINLLGNRKKTRKDVRCFLIEKVVDSDTTNFSDLLESVTDKYPPGYLEVAHVQYYDDENKSFPEVSSDQDLMSMFAKKCKSKIVDMFIIYRHPSEPFEPIIDWDFDDPDECESEADDNDECESDDDDGYLQNPSPDNEHVGIDEEDMYLNATEVNALDMVACSNKGKEKAYAPEDEDHVSDGDSGSDSEYEEVEEDEDSVGEEGNDNQCDEFDKEDPPMVVGSTYPNMSAFKLALSQHAVKREFEYKTVKSAPYRFTAICSRKHMDKCPWRIHASSLGDQRTTVVRTNPACHTCSSTRRSKKVKNATKHWVCDRVKDFLIVDGTLGPVELQKKLKEHYSVHVHYKRVYMDDLMDKIRQMLMVMWNQRRKVSNKVKGVILPHIIKKLNEDSHKLALEVTECSDDVAEVTALGGIGFRFVVNLKDRTCSCRKWDVCGIPCKHALAFITSQTNARIESYVDENYSVQKFRLAYAQLIPAIPDKNHWPKSTHGFFMHPPLLKATAGRPKTERFKGVGEKKKQKGQHKCPICLDYGHHWHTCKKGNPEDIVAMKELRGPPKKRAKKATTSVSSIEPMPTLALPTTMSFPPSRTPSDNGKQAGSSSLASKCQSLETTCNTKRNSRKNDSGASKRSQSGSNQPDLPPLTKDAPGPVKELNKKTRKAVAKKIKKIPLPPSDSPAMGTRSKRVELSIPAESTRSKRRLSL